MNFPFAAAAFVVPASVPILGKEFDKFCLAGRQSIDDSCS
jgi:hypothetical protein